MLQRDQIDALMKGKKNVELTLDVRGSGGETRPLKIEVNSIERPTGFFLVRGK